jgi:hypothetical protein
VDEQEPEKNLTRSIEIPDGDKAAALGELQNIVQNLTETI